VGAGSIKKRKKKKEKRKKKKEEGLKHCKRATNLNGVKFEANYVFPAAK